MTISAGVGRAGLRLVGSDGELNPLEALALSYGIGLGVVGSSLFLLGAIGMMSDGPAYCTSLALLAIAIAGNRDVLIGARRDHQLGPKPDVLELGLAWFVFGLLGLYAFYALAPEIFFDALVYHLRLPKFYWLEGGFKPTPYLLYSGIPMQMEMVYGWALFWGNETLARLLHWSTGFVSVIAMLGIATRGGWRKYGWLGALIFLSTPMIGDHLYRCGIEGGATLWVLCAVSAFSIAQRIEPTKQTRWIALSGSFIGFAMAAKYTFWPLLGVFVIVCMLQGLSRKQILIGSAAAVACVAPWIVKNMWFYGNPIFPFFHEVFHPNWDYPVEWRALHADAKGRQWAAILTHPRQFLEVLLHPWFLTMRGQNDHNHLGPIFLLLLPIFLLRSWRVEQEKVSWRFFLGLWMCWWPLSSMPRFFIPGLAVLCVCLAQAVNAVPFQKFRHAIVLLVALLAVNNATVVVQNASTLGFFSFLIHGTPKEDYLHRSGPTNKSSPYAAEAWINQHTPRNAKVLNIGEPRAYYLDRPTVPNSTIDYPLYYYLLGKANSASDLHERIIELGVTHLMVNFAWLAREQPPPDPTGKLADRLDSFLASYATPVFQARDLEAGVWVIVYAVHPPSAIPRDPGSDYFLYWFRHRRT